jgi:hypothetical protein
MSLIEGDRTLHLGETEELLITELGITRSTLHDRRLLRSVCEAVGIRSARLSAAGVAAVLRHIGQPDPTAFPATTTVAVDGSLFEKYPHFPDRMHEALQQIMGRDAERVVFAKGRGLAVCFMCEGASPTASRGSPPSPLPSRILLSLPSRSRSTHSSGWVGSGCCPDRRLQRLPVVGHGPSPPGIPAPSLSISTISTQFYLILLLLLPYCHVMPCHAREGVLCVPSPPPRGSHLPCRCSMRW